MHYLEKSLQAYILIYLTAFYLYIIRVFYKYGELPLVRELDKNVINISIIEYLFSFIGIVWICLLVLILIKLKSQQSLVKNKLSIFLILYMIVHVFLNPIFFWYVD